MKESINGFPVSTYSNRPETCYETQDSRYVLKKKIAGIIGLYYLSLARDLLKCKQMLECEI
ncbi:MAG: hypothetical protein ACI9SC_002683 [Gammaproteobacteria bacterium]|jgi:hypothetical protein